MRPRDRLAVRGLPRPADRRFDSDRLRSAALQPGHELRQQVPWPCHTSLKPSARRSRRYSSTWICIVLTTSPPAARDGQRFVAGRYRRGRRCSCWWRRDARNTWPISGNPTPARTMAQAREWRNRCDPHGVRPARRQARRTINDTPPRCRPARGAVTLKNTSRRSVRGRAWRRYAAIASPTSTGNGSWSTRCPLPCTVIWPARQSISVSRSAATSQARSPNRSRTRMIA